MFKGLTPLVVVAILLGGAFTASAQQPPLPASVDSGKMVRMYTATTMLEGRLLAPYGMGDSALHYCRFPGRPCLGIEDSAAMRTIPVSDLRRLDVSTGSHWRRGALIGGVLGAAMGVLGTAFLVSMCDTADCAANRDTIVILGGISCGLTFGALGALWGSAFPRWDSR
ncbi:MAG: hypothetical protein IPJ11_14080 [Gemmatimonadetes bacterium]|nr:hypothetical protein [Gemmatimonadota bacterium]